MVDPANGTQGRTLHEALQASTQEFMQQQVGEAIVAWCTKRLHRYRDSLDGELVVRHQFNNERQNHLVDATYRHRLPEGVLIINAKAGAHDETVVTAQLAGREQWTKLLNTIAQTLRKGLDLDFAKSGATIRAKDFGWYEAGKGWDRPSGGVALPPPPAIDPEEERRAIEAVERAMRALGGGADLAE